jgi:transposase
VAKGAPSETDIFVLKELTETIKHLDQQIRQVEARTDALVIKEGLEVVSSVPGVGPRSAAAILAKIGDASRFSNGKEIAAWAGLAPSVHQSAGVSVLGSIIKQGSKWLGRVMVLAARAAVRVRDSKFMRCFCVSKLRRGRRRLTLRQPGRC